MKKKKVIAKKDLKLQVSDLLKKNSFAEDSIAKVIDLIESLQTKSEKSKPYVINTGANTVDKNNMSYVHTKSLSEKSDIEYGRGM